jgi:anti-sigma28 factor (negative regulator of flagellin synthesis)
MRGLMSPSGKRTRAKIRTVKLVPQPAVGVVRLERVAEVRRRIASGWYDRPDVRDSLVEAMLQEFRAH